MGVPAQLWNAREALALALVAAIEMIGLHALILPAAQLLGSSHIKSPFEVTEARACRAVRDNAGAEDRCEEAETLKPREARTHPTVQNATLS